MSTTYRWYTLGLKTPVSPDAIVPVAGMTYEFTGWSRTDDAALAKRDKLDRAGRQGINIYAASRAKAARDVAEVYGVKVEGYMDKEEKKTGQYLIKAAVMREIFCPYTQVILDMRRAVYVERTSGRQSWVMDGKHWDSLSETSKAEIKARAKVYDGRVYFKR